MKRLENKVVWITGSGSGIGRAAALSLAEEGASLVLTGRRRKALEDTAAQLSGSAECVVSPGDITDATSMREIAKAIGEKFGRLDVMINNAGTNIPVRKWSDLQPDGIDTLIHTNLSSAFYCVTAALPLMRQNQDGLFIHIGSRAGRYWDGPSGPGYIAAKAALMAMSHSINAEEHMNGIRSTLLNPGETATPILQNRPGKLTDQEMSQILRPEDCADLIKYIACLPKHVCMNEVVFTPTWNRSFVMANRKDPTL